MDKYQKAALAIFIICFFYYLKQRKPPVIVVKRIPGGFNAAALAPFGIFVTPGQKANNLLLNHEIRHWEQYQQKGLLGYYGEYLYNAFVYGYDLNPMEIDARYEENNYSRTNYTNAVRTGTALTYHNPNFRL